MPEFNGRVTREARDVLGRPHPCRVLCDRTRPDRSRRGGIASTGIGYRVLFSTNHPSNPGRQNPTALRTPCVLAISGIVTASLPTKSATTYAPANSIAANTAPDAICNATRAVGSFTCLTQPRKNTASTAILNENKPAVTIFTAGEITNPAATKNGSPTTVSTTARNHRCGPRLSAKLTVAAAIVAVANPAK